MDAGGVHDMVSRKSNRKHVPPSRRRYEETHPTVTLRVDQALYNQLKSLKEATGQSVADVLRIGLGKAQAVAEQAYTQGAEFGYEEAREEFEVTYWCSGCQQRHMSASTHEQKEAAANLLYRAGWHDPACS